MICPILKAGTMIQAISVERQVRLNVVSTHSDHLRHESAECMGEECEWYDKGCPAHPGKLNE